MVHPVDGCICSICPVEAVEEVLFQFNSGVDFMDHMFNLSGNVFVVDGEVDLCCWVLWLPPCCKQGGDI
eukprot:14179672-Ditylum_brightwellii.AAC.1